MNKKILIVDIIILICSLICCLIFNSTIDFGLTISQTMGYFAISFSVLIMSILVLLITLIIYLITKLKQTKFNGGK